MLRQRYTDSLRSFCLALALSFLAVATAAVFAPSFSHAAAQSFDPNGQWRPLSTDSPSGRRATGYCYDSLHKRLIVFGGFPTYLNDVWALDLTTNAWTHLVTAGTPPTPRYGPSAIYDASRDRVVIFGGFDGSIESNGVYALSLSGVPTWTDISPPGPSPTGRSFHVAGYDGGNDRMIIFGGWDGGVFLGDTWALNFGVTPAWIPLPFLGPTPDPRDLAGVAVDAAGKRMFLFGGWGGSYLSDTWTFSFDGLPTWTQISTAHAPPARREIAVAWDPANQQLVAFAGNDGTLLSDAWALNMTGTPDWQQITPLPSPEPRYGDAAIYDPGAQRMVVFGGLESTGHGNDSWSLSLNGAPKWTRLNRPKLPVRNNTAEYDPIAHQMVIFGGEQRDLSGAYQLTNDLLAITLTGQPMPWQDVSPAGLPPSGRYASRTIWDPIRDRMLVFGGYDGAYRNDLWEYRPRPTPAWTQLVTNGTPPAGRFAGGTVYDAPRDRLIMFGGYSSNDASLPVWYNDTWELPFSGPNAMTWHVLSPSGPPPSPRWGFVMLADPTRQRAILVDGAEDASSPFNDTYTLDLSVDPPVWSPLAVIGSPATGLVIEAGIIEPVGDRLVIFGGWNGGDAIHDTYSLSLSGTPTWSLLSPSGIPPRSRNAITAVYDPVNFGMALVGGTRFDTIYNDTWELVWDQPVAAQASLAESHAEPGLVRIAWAVVDAGAATFSVERQQGASGWNSLGAPAREGADRLSIVDRTVPLPGRYEYRLLGVENGAQTVLSSVQVDVPSGFQLALAGAQPNPSTGDRLTVGFSLERKGPARLDLIDVAGRRVASRDLSTLDAGRHVISVAGEGQLAPGLYLIKLTAGERSLTAKAFVVR